MGYTQIRCPEISTIALDRTPCRTRSPPYPETHCVQGDTYKAGVYLVPVVRPGGITDIATRIPWGRGTSVHQPLAFELNRREK